MAKQIKFGKFLIIEAKASELYVAVGSPGICDNCCKPSSYGYYIAVLNRWFCPECFEEYKKRARYYPEDAAIEKKNFDYYAKMLGLNVSKS